MQKVYNELIVVFNRKRKGEISEFLQQENKKNHGDCDYCNYNSDGSNISTSVYFVMICEDEVINCETNK